MTIVLPGFMRRAVRAAIMRAIFMVAAALAVSTICSSVARADAPGPNEVLKLMDREDLIGDRSLTLEIKPWKGLRGAFVALMYIDAGEVVRTQRLRPTLILLRDKGGKLALVARAEVDAVLCRELPQDETRLEENLDGDHCKAMQLDLAAYRISRSETAVGLRKTFHSVFPEVETEVEGLTLFRIAGKILKPVFFLPAMKLRDEQRGSGDLTTSESTLRISHHRTSGYFDLVVTEKTAVEKLLDTGHALLRERRVQWRYRWRGYGYAVVP